MYPSKQKSLSLVRLVFVFSCILIAAFTILQAQAAPQREFGYGVGVAHPDDRAVLQMGFNWMSVYDLPNQRYAPNVLYRLPLNRWAVQDINLDSWELYQFGYNLHNQLTGYAERIEAYEIGNEVNLYINGWDAPPNAKEYVTLLCQAYRTIKQLDPTATVVSAGLSPVGRLKGTWNGHFGHNQSSQDEREYLKEFLAAGGAACVDAIGYHPNGFSANFDAEPDVDGGTPESNCKNGFCFRGVEKIHEILEQAGYGDKPIWATEVGWIAEPEDASCLEDYSWAGRAWQRVSRQKQAENLVGAFQYAESHWDWMEAMFIFNLNFSSAGYYYPCEQMRFYSIQATSAREALATMKKSVQVSLLYFPWAERKEE